MSASIYRYIVYQTTNLVNQKIYVGVHATTNIDDGYLGSGTGLLRAIKKHGRENFKREILAECGSSEEMYSKEAEIVTFEFISRADTYNACLGGRGGVPSSLITPERKFRNGNGMRGKTHSAETKEKQSESHKGKIFSTETRRKMSESFKGRILSEEHKRKIGQASAGRRYVMSEETKRKISQALKARNRQSFP